MIFIKIKFSFVNSYERYEDDETQNKPQKIRLLHNLPLPLIQRFGMNWRRDRSIRAGRRRANMFSSEVLPMAVKKSTAAKSSAKAAPKAKAATKAAPKVKTATRAKADTKAAPQAPKAGGAKKAAPKKAPVVKLTDPQRRILGEVAGKKEEGL